MPLPDPTTIALHQVVAARAQVTPDFPILTFVHEGDGHPEEAVRTYSDLHRNGRALAGALTGLGVQSGQQVALMMNNHPEFVEAMLATSQLGAVFVPVDPRSMGDKLAHMLDFTDCVGAICTDQSLASILAVAERCKQMRWVAVLGGERPGITTAPPSQLRVVALDTLLASTATPSNRPEATDMDTPMFMMFTSGTTGNPKAVVQTHRDYMSRATALARLGLSTSDGLYNGLSLTHINAQNTLRNGLALGVRTVFSRKFTKRRLWSLCRHYQCTVFNLLGGMIPEIYGMPEQPDDADNPVRFIFTSGMPAAIWQAFERRFGVTILEGYGATEGGGLSNPPGVGPVGSIGKPAPEWEAAILDEDGTPLGPNEEGEICFRRRDGAPITVRYYKNPEASADKVRGGWLRMGDLGHIDENGWFYFHHRVGGGVRRNGDFVNTAVVESVLTLSPLVADVFVYGVATPRNVSGEKTLVAAVVPNDLSSFQAEALLSWCRERLEKNDVPEIIQVLAEIPKTVSEKPIESACIEQLTIQ